MFSHSTVGHSVFSHSAVNHSKVIHSTAGHSVFSHSAVGQSMFSHSTMDYSMLCHSTYTPSPVTELFPPSSYCSPVVYRSDSVQDSPMRLTLANSSAAGKILKSVHISCCLEQLKFDIKFFRDTYCNKFAKFFVLQGNPSGKGVL
jgi:hypothetical protein